MHFFARAPLLALASMLAVTACKARPEAVARLTAASSDAAAINEAIKIVGDLEKKSNALFPTTGYPTLSALENHLAENADPWPRAVAAALKDELFDFTTQQHSAIRDAILANGFLNLYQTNYSSGFADVDLRLAIEASYAGLDQTSYAAVPPEVRPKYGSLQPKPWLPNPLYSEKIPAVCSKFLRPMASDYGDDEYIFKASSLKGRVTYFVGDSYNTFTTVNAAAVAAPQKTWRDVFLPYSYRTLIVPFWSQGEPPCSGNGVIKVGGPHDGVQGPISDGNYIETQMWGPLTMDDVAAFEFTGSPPTGPFLKALQDRGIEIRQLRTNGDVVPYVPSPAVDGLGGGGT